ncbi:MAG: conjugative transposon protein TraM [Chitinophagaceae bacterium]
MKISQSKMRKRKFMLVLPLIVIPFLTLAFYALGGGKGEVKDTADVTGLNLKLPDANLKEDKVLDKLSFYDKADKDSAKMAEYMRSDPYYKEEDLPEPAPDGLEELAESSASKFNQRLKVSPFDKTNEQPEAKLMTKLSLLQKELNESSSPKDKVSEKAEDYSSNPEFSGNVDRLEAMMNNMNGGGEDPEINQLSKVMDKLLDIQHPELVKERIDQFKDQIKTDVMAVSDKAVGDTAVNGFFGLNVSNEAIASNAIEAVVHEGQILVNGSVIKFRLLQDVFIGNNKVPAGNFVSGIVSLNGERLDAEINSIRSGNNIFPVKMEVFDLDGLPGIHIPGAITRDVAKQSADNSLQMMELNTLDPSLKAQAAAAGINTAKSLLTRKVKLVKVMVKAGYKVLLQNNSK